MNNELRDDLLVTMGARAAYMECAGVIRLPAGINGEEELAKFVVNRVDEFVECCMYEIPFDLFIETELKNEYGTEASTDGGLDANTRRQYHRC